MLSTPSIRIFAVSLLAFAGGTAGAHLSGQPRTGLTFERALPPMDGKQLNVKVVDVRYAPGQSSSPHRHGCAVMVYVVSGAVRMGVRGSPDSVYRRGEVFFEEPTDIHQVGANASATDSAHFTATFVCDHAGPLTVPVPPGP
jgi:quercetin dioxygenase-like cupin family protein